MVKSGHESERVKSACAIENFKAVKYCWRDVLERPLIKRPRRSLGNGTGEPEGRLVTAEGSVIG